MRLAILTDIHANREALEAVLADISQRRIDRMAILGDVVGYGPDPEWCTDRVRALVEAGALIVKGNHDSAIQHTGESMNANARAAIDWTRPRLSTEHKAFLAALPMHQTLNDVLFVHASANDPEGWIYVTNYRTAAPSFQACTARVIFCGHVHQAALFTCDGHGAVRDHKAPQGVPIPLMRSRRWLGVIGSVGQPRDGAPAAGYAIFDTQSNELTFRRVPYDCDRTAQKVRAAGLPEALALRLLKGM
ncbi:MAG: metallophosphoesterase family protein [Beijerinckiaceae bacterium]